MTVRATVVVVPRERFSHTRPSLESIRAGTEIPHDLVYVDGGSPESVQAYLEERSRDWGFTRVRAERYLAPNEARNLALARARTPYVAFVDNDVEVQPGWLEALVSSAERTGAWIVGPFVVEGDPGAPTVHHAGGEAWIETRDGRRQFFEHHRCFGRPLSDARAELPAGATSLAEFHCMLVRTEVFSRLGPLDEALRTREHSDLCMSVVQAGGSIQFEPAACVRYVTAGPFDASDVPFYFTRWGEEWNLSSLRHFHRKWNLPEDDAYLESHRRWLRSQRGLILSHTPEALRWLMSRQGTGDL
jgi:GT2 family glycosyltransferase